MNYHQLRWASRRGMLELDLILGPFLDNVYPTLEDEDKRLYQQLMQCEDQDMFNWFLHKEVPRDEAMAKIVGIILQNTGLQVLD